MPGRVDNKLYSLCPVHAVKRVFRASEARSSAVRLSSKHACATSTARVYHVEIESIEVLDLEPLLIDSFTI